MLTDEECDEIIARAAEQGEFFTRSLVRFMDEYPDGADIPPKDLPYRKSCFMYKAVSVDGQK